MSRQIVGSRRVLNRGFNDVRPRGFRYGARVVGQTFVGEGFALFGPAGECASTHSFRALDHPRKYGPHGELFFLPHKEGAGGGIKRGVATSLCLRGNA